MITVTWRARSRQSTPPGSPAGAPAVLLASALVVSGLTGCTATLDATPESSVTSPVSASVKPAKPAKPAKGAKPDAAVKAPSGSALAALKTIPVKGRAPSTGYARDQFGPAWADTDRNGCDQRNDVLRRDLTEETLKPRTRGCIVLTGTLVDKYTGATIAFRKQTASAVQIDHVVALQNAWVTGAFGWTKAKRAALANDQLNLLAVDGPTNSSKGAGDAATWLPPRKTYRCSYVARQVAVKVKYGVWMTAAEHKAVERVLTTCPDQKLPQVKPVPLGENTSPGAKPPAGTAVSAGAFCSPAGAKGVSEAGTAMVCSSKNGDPARWRAAK